ncbi:MAG: extracellular solute-binding protein [Defluviitaleaceae bacterium]|nr:extracellular solute-binding protein [Defluviitaleaceae bacterium]
MRRYLCLAAAFALCAALVFGCAGKQTPASGDAGAGGEPEKVTLKVWVPENQVTTGTIERMQRQFAEKNPQWDITFTTEIQGEDTAMTEVTKDVSNAADVFFFANDQIGTLVNAGALARLGGVTESMVKNTMPQTVVDTATVDGSLYGIPFTHNTFFMFYDKTLFDESDITSLEKIMAKRLPEGVYNFQFDPAGGWKGGAFYYGAGLTIYGADGVTFKDGCNWNNALGLSVTNYLIDLLNNPWCVHAEDAPTSELISDGRLGAWWDGSWNYPTYKEILGENLGLAILPTFNPDGTDRQLRSFYGSKVIGVNALAKFPQVAVAFAAFIGDEDMQVLRFVETQQVPTNQQAGASSAVQTDEVAAVIVQQAAKASVMQPISANFNERYWANAGALFGEIYSGVLTKDNAQERLDTFVETLKVDE